MKIRLLMLLGLAMIVGCDSKSTTGSVPSTSGTHKAFKLLRDEEPLFTHLTNDVPSVKHRLTDGLIHPDLPGGGDHTLDAAQGKLCFESITGTTLPAAAEFKSGRMKRGYSFTKESNPIRNSFGEGELAFRIPRSAAGKMMGEIVAEIKRMDDEREVWHDWQEWEGRKDAYGHNIEVPPPPLDGTNSFRYALNLSDRVHARYYFIYDREAEIFRIEYDYDNTRD